MKSLKLIIALLLLSFTLGSNAQVTKRSGDDSRKKDKNDGTPTITDRQQSFYEVKEPSDADLQWMKIIQREVDLEKGKNAALLYPELPNEDGENLYFIIMRLLAKNKITAYNSMDEIFTDDHKIDVGQMFDNYGIYYTEAKGSTEKNPRYAIEDADIPGNEILSYYIIEKWSFDTRTNTMRSRVDALCPVLHRQDEFGGEPIRFPMFWVKLNDIRPYIAQQYVFTDDDNNLTRYNLDDFFKLNMYQGDIYKVKNLRNLSLMQMYPDNPEGLKHAQDSIEARLHRFDKDLWAPSRQELQAQVEAKRKAEAEKNGETLEEDEANVDNKDAKDDNKKSVRSTKRGGKNNDKGSSKKQQAKKKQQKSKEIKSHQSATRSVRNRKR